MNQAPNIENLEDQEETTPALDVETILAIQRDQNSYIPFVRKPDPEDQQFYPDGRKKTLENLTSIKASDLRTMFPAFAKWLTHDSYFAVNAYYRPAPWKNKKTELPDVWRKEKHLSRLNACYADVDCGRPETEEGGADLTWRQAIKQAGELADAGVIPQPSIMARSGRGVYLLWLLRDVKEPEGLPPRAWPEKVTLFKACNRALGERLRANTLPADRNATDAARVLRTPGSIHRTAGRRVTYIIQADQNGKGFVYTLPEMANFLGLLAPGGDLSEEVYSLAQPATYRKTLNPGTAPNRANGTKELNARRAQDLRTLQTWREGFLKRGMKYPDGTLSPGRRFTLELFCNFLRGAGMSKTEAAEALADIAKNMQPPYPSDPPDMDPPIEGIIADAYATKKRRNWKTIRLCELFGVTAEVARKLELLTIRPKEVALEEALALPTQEETIADRRNLARQYVDVHKAATSSGTLSRFYAEQGIKGANRQTAYEDLRAIGFYEFYPPGKPGRPRKDAQQEEPELPGLFPETLGSPLDFFRAHTQKGPTDQ